MLCGSSFLGKSECISSGTDCLSIFSLDLHVKREYLSFWIAAMLCCMALGFFSFFQARPLSHTPLVANFASYGGIILALHLAFSFNDSMMIQLKDDGFAVVRKERVSRMAWSQAQFFACYRLPSLFLGRETTLYYELSSSNERVTWMEALGQQSFLSKWKPGGPADEYHAQMRAFSELVKKKTGLTFYDLSRL